MTGFLIGVIMYVFGIAMMQAAEGTVAGDLYFSNLSLAMYSLLIHATFMDGPSVVLDDLNTGSCLIFLTVIVLSALLLLNMLIGVLCEVVTNVSETERGIIEDADVREKVEEMLRLIDSDGSSTISKKELAEMVQNQKAIKILRSAGVDIAGLLDVADLVFQSDNSGRSFEKELDIDEFLAVIKSLRGSNTATVKDIMQLRRFMNKKTTLSVNHLERVEERLRHQDAKLRDLVHSVKGEESTQSSPGAWSISHSKSLPAVGYSSPNGQRGMFIEEDTEEEKPLAGDAQIYLSALDLAEKRCAVARQELEAAEKQREAAQKDLCQHVRKAISGR
mmetsp:Transcript_65088/g.115685  ORF Transcript_65088/g.115685 Transcript_65088/m.115685 type:complete len:333 (+) Transcript_65088:3-1001(+)